MRGDAGQPLSQQHLSRERSACLPSPSLLRHFCTPLPPLDNAGEPRITSHKVARGLSSRPQSTSSSAYTTTARSLSLNHRPIATLYEDTIREKATLCSAVSAVANLLSKTPRTLNKKFSLRPRFSATSTPHNFCTARRLNSGCRFSSIQLQPATHPQAINNRRHV
jgi:hypothetical protein